MNILVVGAGGREHAIVWRLAQSKHNPTIYVAPGNDGMKDIAQCVDIQVDQINELVSFAKEKQIDLTVVGPELPLTLGIVDEFQKNNLRIFGPSKKAAQLEGSKTFSKNLMKKYHIPTAKFESFTDAKEAKAYIDEIGIPCVVKADGLAAGKGVIICQSEAEAIAAIDDILLENKFGTSGARIVIEEFLEGEEVSVLAICDGEHILPLASSQDHKRIFDNDEGDNTGGMGAYSPAPIYTDDMRAFVEKNVLRATVDAMAKENAVFTGILYAGIIVTKDGPKVLEFNARFGDPEAQPLLMRMDSDLVDVLYAATNGELDKINLEWKEDAAVCVVLASKGYPASSSKGDVIKGLSDVSDEAVVFHAATKWVDDHFVTNGGRVLGVTARGRTIKEAIDKAYEVVNKISFEGMQYRKDIGAKALMRD